MSFSGNYEKKLHERLLNFTLYNKKSSFGNKAWKKAVQANTGDDEQRAQGRAEGCEHSVGFNAKFFFS
ncbi:conserved hypothetical protein [Ricinus communis]|uniref:Uncharacterized protein n=1 Tax=Ricinus communis TaxID=3988 RepID=B9T2B1_RICCO|nr:conserved hypothetical protein [Ricinus communis]